MARTSDAGKRADWESPLRPYQASGLAIGAFCTRESVSVASFYYWSRRLGGHCSKPMSEEAVKSATDRRLGDDDGRGFAERAAQVERLEARITREPFGGNHDAGDEHGGARGERRDAA